MADSQINEIYGVLGEENCKYFDKLIALT